ncbi:MAG: FG-GAP-like repeat-containing protein [Spirochaetes bacterium]|nr:FG-GAP-like repeat-containing protein [Spirochaetota bacterium]
MNSLKSYFLAVTLLFHACDSEMVSKALTSMQDPRVPEIEVSQGAADIENGAAFLLEFGNGVKINAESEDVIFTIANIGTADLEIANFSLSGDDQDNFLIFNQSTDPIIPAGRNTTFNLKFAPFDTDQKSADITIETNDPLSGIFSFTVSARSKPMPDFSAELRRGLNPLTVVFKDKSSGDITSWEWDFNADGIIDSNEQNPAHTYTNTGTYSVILTVNGFSGADFRILTNYVSVTEAIAYEFDNYFKKVNCIYAADIDSDENMDIIGTRYEDSATGELAWWKNDGTGKFSKYTIATGADYNSVQAGDIDDDGDIDIVTTIYGDMLYWWENDDVSGPGTGNGLSWTGHTITMTGFGQAPASAITSDIDSDGDIDIMCVSSHYYVNNVGEENIDDSINDISWWQNGGSSSGGGDGSVWLQHDLAKNYPQVNSVYAAKIDNNLSIDILSTRGGQYTGSPVGYWGDVTWWQNDGSNNFTPITIDSTFAHGSCVIAADIDGDMDNDVIAAAFQGDEIAWWENIGTPGSGTFGSRQVIGSGFSGASSLFAADMDNDGDQDIIGAARYSNDVSWWKNDGTGTFTKHAIDSQFNEAISVLAADLNNDGNVDPAAAAYDGNKIVWWDMIQNGWWYKRTVGTGYTQLWSVFINDINSDGYKDIITSDIDPQALQSIVSYSQNDGSGSFSSARSIMNDFSFAISLTAADLDNDGRGDIIAGGFSGDISWSRNDGEETFSAITSIATGPGMVYIIRANDLDRDGDIDLAAVFYNTGGPNFEIAWMENTDANGTFSGIKTIQGTMAISGAVMDFADLDNDGNTDIIGHGGANQLVWWKNNGDKTFQASQSIGLLDKPNSISAADIDGDGQIDIVFSSHEEGFFWYRNNGDASSWTFQDCDTGEGGAHSIDTADMDKDGDIDVILSIYDLNQISWWENDGDGVLTKHIILNDFSGVSYVHAEDLDSDGDIDITGRSSGQMFWWENNLK